MSLEPMQCEAKVSLPKSLHNNAKLAIKLNYAHKIGNSQETKCSAGVNKNQILY